MKRALPFVTMLAAGLARADYPMNYLSTQGPAADPATRLNWGLLTISVAVCVIIGVLVLWATLRHRPPLERDADGRWPVAPARGGMRWIYIGVGVSTLVLFGSTIWTVMTLSAVAAPTRPPALAISVTAHQWWWEVRYESSSPQQIFVTANEIHIPVGQPVRVKLGSDDVIHSFWIPKLAGKTDIIPGQENHAWLQADRAGEYRGQCGEYCGPQHAHMALHVVADEPAAFDAWRRTQLLPSVANAGDGGRVFGQHCAVCHTVRGTEAHGRLGPDLTHLMSRSHIAAGILPNNTGTLTGWVENAQGLKPGTRMPAMQLRADELQAIVGYLQTLK